MWDFIHKSFADHRLVIRYGIAGVTGILSNMATLYVATEYFHIWYLASAVISYIVGLFVTFSLQKYWTFRRTEGSIHMQFASYTIIAIISLCVDIVLLYLFVQVLGLWYIFSQGLSLGIIALGSFLANRHVTFERL